MKKESIYMGGFPPYPPSLYLDNNKQLNNVVKQNKRTAAKRGTNMF